MRGSLKALTERELRGDFGGESFRRGFCLSMDGVNLLPNG
jgi:hypothetical protein